MPRPHHRAATGLTATEEGSEPELLKAPEAGVPGAASPRPDCVSGKLEIEFIVLPVAGCDMWYFRV
jgi:hypothetical protein